MDSNYNQPSKNKGVNYDRRNKLIAVTVISLFVITYAGFMIAVLVRSSITQNTYLKAEELVRAGLYEEAKVLFEKIEESDFKDTSAYLILCEAHIYYDAGDLQSAYETVKYVFLINASVDMKNAADNFEAMVNREHAALTDPRNIYTDRIRNRYDVPITYDRFTTETTATSYVYKPSKPKEDDDPYNAKDYMHPEDFYEDHYYDFFDFYDAENYFYEHNE